LIHNPIGYLKSNLLAHECYFKTIFLLRLAVHLTFCLRSYSH